MKKIFIIGSHRTGSKLLGEFFQERFEKTKSIHQYGALRFVNILSNLKIAGFLPEFLYLLFLKYYWFSKWNKDIPGIEHYIESNGFNFLAVKYAQREFENIKVIHLVRHPKSFVLSMMNWVYGRFKSKIANSIIPFWNITGFTSGEKSLRNWTKLNKPEKLLWTWRYKNEFIEKEYNINNNLYLRIRLEDFIDLEKRKETLEVLCNFCELEYDDSLQNYFDVKKNESDKKYFSSNDFEELVDHKFFNAECHELMTKYGYE